MQLVQKATSAELEKLVRESGESLQSPDMILSADQEEKILRYILGREESLSDSSSKVRRLTPKWWWAAASLLLLVGLAAYLIFFMPDAKDINLAGLSQKERFSGDISPAKQRVLLTLPDGSTQVLDGLANGAISLPGIDAIKKDGTITYTDQSSATVVYNTIATEKGRIFHLQLSDGTEVWLDAQSSIRFPVSFPPGDREVEITGQAYFEASPSISEGGVKRKFIVRTSKQTVEVLGTQFNINSYDPAKVQTTLLEGSVRVTTVNPSTGPGPQSAIINPGQQVTATGTRQLIISNDADLTEVMAWKNGKFQFNGSSVNEIMSQLSRWYDIEVINKDKISETFVADIERDLPVSKLLALLEMTKQIKFIIIDGKKVTVMKY